MVASMSVLAAGLALYHVPLRKARLLSAESDISEGTNPAARSITTNSHRYISVLGRGVGPAPTPAAAAVGVAHRDAAAFISRVCRAFAASVAGTDRVAP
jgi:hypothetical protein